MSRTKMGRTHCICIYANAQLERNGHLHMLAVEGWRGGQLQTRPSSGCQEEERVGHEVSACSAPPTCNSAWFVTDSELDANEDIKHWILLS